MKKILEIPTQEYTAEQHSAFLLGLLKIIAKCKKQKEVFKLMDKLKIKYTYEPTPTQEAGR